MRPVIGAGPVPGLADLRSRVLFCLVCLVVSVALPSLMRSVGLSSGEVALAVQSGLIILVGLLAGPGPGAITGALTAVVGFGLTGVPEEYLVLFVLAELAGCGFVAGVVGRQPVSPLCGVLLAQVGGRLARLVAVAFAADGMTDLTSAIGQGWASVREGLLAVILQWLLLPPIVIWVRTRAAAQAAGESSEAQPVAPATRSG